MYETVSGFCVDRTGYNVQPCEVERVSDWLFFKVYETHSDRGDGSRYIARHYQPISLGNEFFYDKASALHRLVSVLDIELREARTKLNLLQRVSRKVQAELETEEQANA